MLPGRFSTYLYLKSWFVAILTQMSVEEFCRVVEIMYKRFEDTKLVIRGHKLKEDRQYNGLKEKDKMTKNLR